MVAVNKIDSNLTNLAVAEEDSIGVLPVTPNWYDLEPNEYGETGVEVTATARTPITSGRQKQKGVITDINATAGFGMDFMDKSMEYLLPGFFFAEWRTKETATPTDVTATGYTVADASGFAVGDLVDAEGLVSTLNTGLKTVTGTTATEIQASGLELEAIAPVNSKITKVGVEATAGDIQIDASGSLPKVISTTLDFTTLGLVPGEWIILGGTDVATQFADTNNNGFVRVSSISANELVLDRQPVKSAGMATDTGAGKTIHIIVGNVLKNESDPNLILCKSYTFERSLGAGGYEYIEGAVANTIEFKATAEDKTTVDLGYVALDTRFESTKELGNRFDFGTGNAYNGSCNYAHVRLQDSSLNLPLFTYLTELTLTINNGVSPAKSIAKCGSFDINAGDFSVAGNLTAYFSSTEAVKAVRENRDVSIDFALTLKNRGWLFDLPLTTLGDGKLNIEKDEPITIPLTMDGAESVYGHTLLSVYFRYVPDYLNHN